MCKHALTWVRTCVAWSTEECVQRRGADVDMVNTHVYIRVCVWIYIHILMYTYIYVFSCAYKIYGHRQMQTHHLYSHRTLVCVYGRII